MCIERVEVDNRLPCPRKEYDGLQPKISCGGIVNPSKSDIESPSTYIGSTFIGTYCIQRVELDNTLRMTQKESDIVHPNLSGGSNGTGADETISKKSSKFSKIGSILSQKGSTISRKMSKISHKSTKITDPDDIQSEFSVFLDTRVPDSQLKLHPFVEVNDKVKKNTGLSIFDEYDETKSVHSADSK